MTAALALLVLSSGCATPRPVDRETVADRVHERTGARPRIRAPDAAVSPTAPPEIPPGVSLDDGLGREEAVAVALWNNADFQVTLADLGFARADLLEAGLLRNPVLALLFPVGPKQLEATLRWPIEVLWERPRRVAAASLAMEATAERLVQAGLDLASAVKIAHADLVLARHRRRLADDNAELARRIDQLSQSRLDAGDIGTLEARAARVDAARATHDAARARHDVNVARDRLRGLLGFAIEGPPFEPAEDEPTSGECGEGETLLADALASRPDVRAAELGMEAAAARLGWERSRVLALTAVVDANEEGTEGSEIGPGIDLGIPLFDRNQAGKARGASALERATHAYAAARQRVASELREATTLYAQARESQSGWRDSITGPLEENVAAAESSFAQGDTSYLFVLENTRRLAEARLREIEIAAEVARARARIERAAGRACGAREREVTSGF